MFCWSERLVFDDIATRIIDLWGVGLGHIGFAKDFLAVAVKQTVVLYPETLDRVLVVNAASRSCLIGQYWPLLCPTIIHTGPGKVEVSGHEAENRCLDARLERF